MYIQYFDPLAADGAIVRLLGSLDNDLGRCMAAASAARGSKSISVVIDMFIECACVLRDMSFYHSLLLLALESV